MGAVGAAERATVGERRDSDAGAQRDDQKPGAAAARPVGVLADRGGGRVVVDHARHAETLADDGSELDVAEGGQRLGVLDDGEAVHRAAGSDADSAQAWSARGNGGDRPATAPAGLEGVGLLC
jgi:hypothetical protein